MANKSNGVNNIWESACKPIIENDLWTSHLRQRLEPFIKNKKKRGNHRGNAKRNKQHATNHVANEIPHRCLAAKYAMLFLQNAFASLTTISSATNNANMATITNS